MVMMQHSIQGSGLRHGSAQSRLSTCLIEGGDLVMNGTLVQMKRKLV